MKRFITVMAAVWVFALTGTGCAATLPATTATDATVSPGNTATVVTDTAAIDSAAAWPRPQVTMLAGNAAWLPPGETVPIALALNDFLPYGAELATDYDGEVELTVADAGRVALKNGSKCALTRDAAGITLYLDEGTAQNMLDRLNGRDYTVVTPSLVAGVRGTVFEVTADPDGTTEVQVDSGAVSVDNQLTGEELTVRGGSAARAGLGERLLRATYRRAAVREQKRMEFKALGQPRAQPNLAVVLARMEARLAETRQRAETAAQQQQRLQQERAALADSSRPRARLRLAQIDAQLQAAGHARQRQQRQLAAQQRWLEQQARRRDLTDAQRLRLTAALARLDEMNPLPAHDRRR